MLKNKFKIFLLILITLSSFFLVNLAIKTAAKERKRTECKIIHIPTTTGNANYCPMVTPLKLDPANHYEINAGQSIEIKVIDGKGPFIWGDPGNGYTWVNGDVVDPAKPKKKTTTARSNTLQAASGT